MIKVIALDDHQLVLEGLKNYFYNHKMIDLQAVFTQSADATDYIVANSPDVLLLDLHLNNEDGMTLCKQYRKQFPLLKILILTSIEQAQVIKTVLKNGANGYLLKNTNAEIIVEAIITVHRGEDFLPSEIAKLAIMGASANPSSQYLPKLSSREKEVLALIIAENSTKEIAAILFLSIDTVETHRANLIQKLGVKNTAGLVCIALEKGLV
jgi:DNA-binding NarL/FixJ family response regulator